MVEKTQEIDMDLYSRQIGTFGMEAMGKLMQLKTLIVGMRGLGVETAKNLILAGPATVTLYDPTITSMRDMGSNFYLT
jgi:ubiquitin-activating enzyme E1